MTRSRLDSFPNHYCLCLELYRDIRLQCMIRKSFVHRLSLILILDEISIEMCSVFDRFCTMKFSRFSLSYSKQLIHYSASVGSCQALFKTFFKKFSVPTSASNATKGLEPARCASEKRSLFGDDKIELYSHYRHLSTTFSNFFKRLVVKVISPRPRHTSCLLAEETLDFDFRILHGIRSVNQIICGAGSKIPANGAGRSVFELSRTH